MDGRERGGGMDIAGTLAWCVGFFFGNDVGGWVDIGRRA